MFDTISFLELPTGNIFYLKSEFCDIEAFIVGVKESEARYRDMDGGFYNIDPNQVVFQTLFSPEEMESE